MFQISMHSLNAIFLIVLKDLIEVTGFLSSRQRENKFTSTTESNDELSCCIFIKSTSFCHTVVITFAKQSRI